MTKETPSIRPGRYRHYKGQEYLVQGVVRHSETLESLVLYQPQYGERGWWVRPWAMFEELVTLPDGRQVVRFEYLGPASN